MVEQITDFVGQLASFIQQHVPSDRFPRPDGIAFGLLAGGVLLSVLGARLARPVVTLAFGAAGVGLAWVFGRGLDFPMAATVVIAACAAGAFGFALFRLWVGIGLAALLATFAVSVYASQRIVPHLASFEEMQPVTCEYVIPDVSLDERDPWESLRASCCDFWEHVTSRETDVERKTLLIAVVAGLVGLGLGVFAVRFSLVVFTALLGTSLVVSAIGLGLHCYHPEVFAAVQNSPRAVGGAVLGFLGVSLVLQALLTRRPPESKPAPAE